MTAGSRRIELITSDGVIVAGDFYPASAAATSAARTALLLHMMPATRLSWRPFAELLAAVGVQSLAIDLRGHGESTRTKSGLTLDYRAFTPAEHQAKRHEVAEAVAWLQAERGVIQGELALVGASIGANLAIDYAATHPNVRATVALSPGLDYKGLTTADRVTAMQPGQALLLVASEDDQHGSWETVNRLVKLRRGVELMGFADAGHGTTMFERSPDLMPRVRDWLIDKLVLKP
jgi:pimeloyl-ACP methyl ester carboxylesterase